MIASLLVGSLALFLAGISFDRHRFTESFLLVVVAGYFLIAAIGSV